ncbi:hypothetical protein Droror1_Dr00022929 [Drosera rotundifolia]
MRLHFKSKSLEFQIYKDPSMTTPSILWLIHTSHKLISRLITASVFPSLLFHFVALLFLIDVVAEPIGTHPKRRRYKGAGGSGGVGVETLGDDEDDNKGDDDSDEGGGKGMGNEEEESGGGEGGRQRGKRERG